MSSFSDKLAFYINKSGFSLKYLSEQSGIEHTHLIKIRKGTRSLNNRENFYKLVELLQLTVSDREDLIESWEIEQIGESQYARYIAVKKMIESIREKPNDLPDGQKIDIKIPEGNHVILLHKPTDVNQAIHMVISAACARGDESARIHSNLRDDFLMDFLAIIMTEYPETEFQHIVPFLPARQDDRDRSENVERFGKLCPLLFHNGNYKPMYYYTENAAMDDRFLLPNVMITSA